MKEWEKEEINHKKEKGGYTERLAMHVTGIDKQTVDLRLQTN